MAYNVSLDFRSKLAVTLIAIVCLSIAGCASSEQIPETRDSSGVTPETPLENQSSSTNEEASEKRVSNSIKITYRNKNTDMEVTLDPNKEDFFLDLSGMSPAEKDTIVIADSTLIKQRAVDMQKLLSSFRAAQDLFYKGEYNEALLKVNESLRIQETADAYGLKGTIYFMLNRKSATRENWDKAVKMDPDIMIPDIPELEDIIKDIKGDTEQ
ncbi:MAG TPA: hypothetical protein DF712_11095 [Balneola sp.]|nr:hypothetical protein [Bacteroidota bacterium]HCI72855.1 hypothetical protein [Balneola sp.]HCT52993.1 hypothetical protein [Balneola sp.]|tara:strand:+ start:16918 stop:17553 length:636 start_codon:yes stop_codon:yes gene_type:complete